MARSRQYPTLVDTATTMSPMVDGVDAYDANAFNQLLAIVKELQARVGDDTYGQGPSNGWVSQQPTPNLTVLVSAVSGASFGPTRISKITSAPFTVSPTAAHATLNRIDLVTLDSAGTLAITAGTAGATPSAPADPTDKIVLAELYIRATSTAIYNTDQGGTSSYIKNRVAQRLILPYPAAGSITGAMVVDGTLMDADINAAAEIAVSKLADGAANEVLVTNPDGVTVNWAKIVAANITAETITANEIAANAIGASELADNAVDTAAILDGAVTSAKIAGSAPVRTNLLTNGGRERWQRGTGSFTATGAYTADRWRIELAGTDTITVTQESGSTNKKANSQFSLKAVFTLGSGAGASRIYERLAISDDWYGLLAQALAYVDSVKLGSGVASAVRVGVKTDGTGGTTTYSGYHGNNTNFEELSPASITVPTDATYVEVGVYFAASCTAYLDNAMLVLGSVAADYAPLHPAQEMERCERYFQALGGDDDQARVGIGQCVNTTIATCILPLKTKMYGAPSLTVPDATKWAVTNAGGTLQALTTLTLGRATRDSVSVTATVASGTPLVGGNACQLVANSDTAARIFLESNP